MNFDQPKDNWQRETFAEVITRAGGVILRPEENGGAGSCVRRFAYLIAKAS